ncbi:hypothetical protein HK105_202588 [Polyrhizophydium stewartii]|uniref:Uncharacterized protein n=1 Tax=Polyrhizophydium stewartii TaxID=2732419 RepID=A0ABR4NDZ3_9FUNG
MPVVADAFPGLEISAVFAPGLGGHVYLETGGIMGFYPTQAVVEIPMFERMSREEEERLGSAGISKQAVGILRATGECKYGCATVRLTDLALYPLDQDGTLDRERPVWTWTSRTPKQSS